MVRNLVVGVRCWTLLYHLHGHGVQHKNHSSPTQYQTPAKSKLALHLSIMVLEHANVFPWNQNFRSKCSIDQGAAGENFPDDQQLRVQLIYINFICVKWIFLSLYAVCFDLMGRISRARILGQFEGEGKLCFSLLMLNSWILVVAVFGWWEN